MWMALVAPLVAACTPTEAPPSGIAIATCADLQLIRENLTADYFVENDIDCSETRSWNGGLGFAPIGDAESPFTGTLDGRRHEIHGLYVARPDEDGVGLFGVTEDAVLARLVMLDASVRGYEEVGILVGRAIASRITDSLVSGRVTGYSRIGGVAGATIAPHRGSTREIVDPSVEQSVALVVVAAVDDEGRRTEGAAGGLVGNLTGRVERSFAFARASGRVDIGGLVGVLWEGTVEESFSLGEVHAGWNGAGGLAAWSHGTISDSFSLCSVSHERSDHQRGGLVGTNHQSRILRAYSTGVVLPGGGTNGGGLVGVVDLGGDFEEVSSYWDTERSGWESSASGEGRTSAEMSRRETFVGWDFDRVWFLDAACAATPLLRAIEHPPGLCAALRHGITAEQPSLATGSAPDGGPATACEANGKLVGDVCRGRGFTAYSVAQVPVSQCFEGALHRIEYVLNRDASGRVCRDHCVSTEVGDCPD